MEDHIWFTFSCTINVRNRCRIKGKHHRFNKPIEQLNKLHEKSIWTRILESIVPTCSNAVAEVIPSHTGWHKHGDLHTNPHISKRIHVYVYLHSYNTRMWISNRRGWEEEANIYNTYVNSVVRANISYSHIKESWPTNEMENTAGRSSSINLCDLTHTLRIARNDTEKL